MPEGMLPLFLILLRFLTREDKRCSLIFCLFYKSRIYAVRNLFYNYVMLWQYALNKFVCLFVRNSMLVVCILLDLICYGIIIYFYFLLLIFPCCHIYVHFFIFVFYQGHYKLCTNVIIFVFVISIFLCHYLTIHISFYTFLNRVVLYVYQHV
jgi:hypothetical protein